MWDPEQIFWLNVVCKENAAKVRYDSLSPHAKGKPTHTRTLFSLLLSGSELTG